MTERPTEEARHPYYIVAPDYRESSAGVRVMHRLCHLLNTQGFEAYIVGAANFSPELDARALDGPSAARHRRENLIPVAVYPEIITGNPLRAPVCVRYMLNKEGRINGNPINPGPDDLFFYYSKAFTPTTDGRYDYLRLNTHDLDLFKPDPAREKRGPLLYVNRIPLSAIDFSALPTDIEVLSNLNPLSLVELAKKLQSATVLYSYEATATCTLAMLCGCPVVALTLPGYERYGFTEQTLSIYGGCGYALNDSEEALNAARAGLPKLRTGMQNTERAFHNELQVFIRKTQERARALAQDKPVQKVLDDLYQDWIAHREQTLGRAAAKLAGESGCTTRFHLVVVHDGTDEKELARTLRSLAGQSHQHTFTSVVSALPAPPELNNRRLSWTQSDDCWNAVGTALERARPGDWVGVVRAGDLLSEHTLSLVAAHLDANPHLRAVYTDEDVIEEFGMRHSPRIKPDFCPRWLRASGYSGSLLLARHEDWLAVGGWRHLPGYEDEHDLASRLAEHLPAASIGHVAEVLYHRSSSHPALARDITGEPAPHIDEQPAEAGSPQVSILIPTRDELPILQRCIETLFAQTTEVPFELIIVDHGSTDADACTFLAGLPAIAPDRIRVLRADGEFNFAALINHAAHQARGEFLLLLNNDTAALHPDWLSAMLAEMQDPKVGVVGPRMVFPDGRIQHGGAVLGLSGAADYPWVGAGLEEPGYLRMLTHAREVSAVSGAALLIRHALFVELGGMDERFAIAYADIDLCLRAARAGYRCIWTPHATLLHEAGHTLKRAFASPQAAAAAQQRFMAARTLMLKQWLPQLAHDPCYNVNLSLRSRRFELEYNPVLQPFAPDGSAELRMLALPADDSGSGHYRVQQPASATQRHGMAAVRLASGYPEAIHFERLGIRTLFSQRQVDDNHLQTLTELRELLPGLRIVIDFDDLLTAVPRHSAHYQSVWKDMPRRLETLGRLCDCLTVSTAPLAEAMRACHPDIRHIPNGIDPRLWQPRPAPQRTGTGKLRVGWAGGISHAGDLAVVRSLVAALANEVEWVFLGMCLEDMRPHLAEFHEGVPFAAYPAKLAELELDLAIAPLEINRFNECKSNLRLLEYGALGIPVVATDVLPYRCGLPVTLVDNRPQSWIRAIRERIGERDALRRDGAALREAVLRDWTIEKTLPAWVSAWTQ